MKKNKITASNSKKVVTMLDFFEITIEDNDDTGVKFNALVDIPAHMKSYVAFSKKPTVKYHFNEEKRIVTGVMISAGTPIYRRDASGREFYVVFKAPTIEKIRDKFFREGRANLVNEMHDENKVVKGIYMIENYIIGGINRPTAPECFANQNLQPGTWIASYKITDNKIWEKAKKGEFGGFSVEGLFYEEQAKITIKNRKMSKKKKTIWEMMGLVVAAVFAKATTADGVVIMYEGELGEGTPVFVEMNGEQIPAPAGDHEVTLEDGTVKIITVDEAGLVSAITEPDNMEGEELRAEVAETMKAVMKDVNARFEAVEKENKELKAEVSELKKSLSGAGADKFKKNQLAGDGKKLTYKEILEAQKK